MNPKNNNGIYRINDTEMTLPWIMSSRLATFVSATIFLNPGGDESSSDDIGFKGLQKMAQKNRSSDGQCSYAGHNGVMIGVEGSDFMDQREKKCTSRDWFLHGCNSPA